MFPAAGNDENAYHDVENSGNVTPVRTRKLWIDHDPYTPPQDLAVEEQITLKLTHFAKKPIVDFGVCKLNKPAVRELVIDNCNFHDVDVIVERFPYKKHFSISKKKFSIDGNSSEVLLITWTPADPGNYRELAMINYEGFRLQFLLLGTVKEKPMKKRRRPLRPLNQEQNMQMSRPSSNQSPAKTKPLHRLHSAPLREQKSATASPQVAEDVTVSEPTHSSPLEAQATPTDVTLVKEESEDSLETPPTVKKMPVSKPDFEYFQFKDHLQQSLGRPTFVVAQTPPSELPPYCADKGSKPSSHDSTPTGRPTFSASEAPPSELPSSEVDQEDSLDDHDRLLRSFHERARRQTVTDDATEVLIQNATQVIEPGSTGITDGQHNTSLHSNTSTATYVVGEEQGDASKSGTKRKSLAVSRPRKPVKSPKLETAKKKLRATPEKAFRRSRGSGTPKGKTIQKLRASKAGRTNFSSPRKLSARRSMPALNKEETSPSTTKNKRRSQVVKQPTLAGIKRSAMIEAKRPTKKKPVKGFPMAHLVLKSDAKTAQRRHPLTYASRNQFYDAKWRIKQERALACWANYVLTPDEFKPVQMAGDASADVKILASATKVQPAMSKETASLRAYQIGRRLNSLRRAACNLFLSPNLTSIIRKVEQEVDTGRLKVRADRPLWKDLGCRRKLLGFLMNFHPIWLRLGLEAVFGETVPVPEGHPQSVAVSRFIKNRLLHDDDIALAHAHPTVPHSYRPGFEDELGKHTLKKILVLVYFLDQAKTSRLIDHDPCLFEKGATINSCRELLITISREFLSGEGDVIKHLSYLGYHVTHQQSYLDEFEYGIHNIAVDMRDGIRLTRMTEILFQDWSLSSKLRYPPGSLLQKRHNVGVAIKALASNGICVKDDEGKAIDTEHIVNGNCDKTLSLIWNVAAHFQLVNAVNEKQVEDEVLFLQRTLKLKHQQPGLEAFELGDDTVLPEASTDVEKTSALLLKWCKYVCAHHGVEVHNFVNSFADGRVLATLLSHYQPQLVPPSTIKTDTTLNMRDSDANEGSSAQSSRETYLKLQRNEKANFLMVKRAVYELGGIPSLICIDDFCGTIPDSKVVRLLVACLCTRLIDVREEERAARIIQITWANYVARKQEKIERERIRLLKEKSAALVTSNVKAWICRKRFLKIKQASTAIQTYYRGYKATRLARREFLAMKKAAIRIQSFLRMVLAKQTVGRMRENQALLELHTKAAVVIQRAWRRHALLKARNQAATAIQARYRGATQRKRYLNLRKSAVVFQLHWRARVDAKQQRNNFKALKRATVLAQAHFRRLIERRRFLALRSAALAVQTRRRGLVERRWFVQNRAAALTIQRRWRAHHQGVQCRSYFLTLRASVVKIQAQVRGFLARKQCEEMRLEVRRKFAAAACIQSHFRALVARRRYLRLRKAAVKIQSWHRGVRHRREFVELKESAVAIQHRFRANLLCKRNREAFLALKTAVTKMQAIRRGSVIRREFYKKRSAAVAIQAWYKGARQQMAYAALKRATVVIQTRYRASRACKLQRRHYQLFRSAVIRIQAFRRGAAGRRAFLCQKMAVVTIQAHFRGWRQRKRFNSLKCAVAVLQMRWRARVLGWEQRKKYGDLRNAVIKMQAARRGTLCRRELKRKHRSAAAIQALYRGWRQRITFESIKSAASVLQARWRARALAKEKRNEYLKLKDAVLKMQAMRRGNCCRKRYLAVRRAVVVAQAHIRGAIARREFTIKRQAAVTLQSTYRGFVQRQRFSALKSATVCLQRHWRALLLARKERLAFAVVRRSAIKIQAHWRGSQQRQRFLELKEATLVIQTRFRATLRAKMQKKEFQAAKSACIKIQSFYRRHLAKKHLCRLKRLKAEKERKIRAATLLQSVWRGRAARTQFIKQRRAAVIIQSTYRMWRQKQYYTRLHTAVTLVQRKWRATQLARTVMRNYRALKVTVTNLQAMRRGAVQRRRYTRLKAAATTIQAHFRARKTRTSYEKVRRAAINIQSSYRGFAVRREIAEKRRAVRCIEAHWRAYLLRRRAQKQFQDLKTVTILVQARYRSKVQRRKFNALKAAAIAIQMHWRATIVSRGIRAHYDKLKASCVVIQACYRGRAARKRFKEFKCAHVRQQARNKAATAIQAFWRCAVRRREYTTTKRACVKIQAWYRGATRRQLYVAALGCIVRVQARWRATLRAREERRKFLLLRTSVLMAQAFWRMTRERRQFLALRRSVVLLQARVRGNTARRRFRETVRSAVTIQAFVKGRQARQRYLRKRDAAKAIQAFWRATLAAREARRSFLRQRESVVAVQSFYRGYVARKSYRHMLEQRQRAKAATAIRAFWKRHVERKKFILLRKAAVAIQSCFRAHAQRQKYLRQRNAATLIQRRWRAVLLGRQERIKFVELRSAAVCVQSLRRAAVARRRFLKLKSAAVVIQSSFRAWSARRFFVTARVAAVKVQSWYRRAAARNAFLRKRKAACVIQVRWRAHICCQMAVEEHRKAESAATCIQAHWRGAVQRQRYVNLKAAVKAVQTRWRAKTAVKQARQRYFALRESCVTIQAHYRGYKARQRYRALLNDRRLQERRNAAATAIQKIWRGRTQRRDYLFRRNAAVRVQAWYRGLKQKRKFVATLRSALAIQTRWRATLLARQTRLGFVELKTAAVLLQSYRRGAMERRRYLALRRSVVTIQACFRGRSSRIRATEKLSSIVKLQALARARMARRRYVALKIAAVAIQTHWRARKRAKATRESFLEARKAAVVLQSWFRGYSQRRAYATLLEKRAAQRRVQLMMIGLAARDHLNAIVIQRAYRRCVARAHYKAKIEQVVKVQRWWRATLVKIRLQKMHKAAAIMQRQYRKHLLIRHFSAVAIQKTWRMHEARKLALTRKKAILCIQATWRGHKVRQSQLQFPGITYRRQRIEEASRRASLHPENTLHNRLSRALNVLFNKKYWNQVRTALEELERTSELLGACCEHIVEAGGIQILFRFFSVCSRDFVSGSIIYLSIKILSNLLSHPPCADSVKETMGQHIDQLVNVFAKFQDRGGRDKSNRPVFIAACNLLLLYLGDAEKAKDFLLNHQINAQRLRNMQKETERRYKKESERTGVQRRMHEIHKIGYLNDSSVILEQSFVRERSFVCGMLGTMASTSTPSRKTAPNLPEQAAKPKTTRKPKTPALKPAPPVPTKPKVNTKARPVKPAQPLKPTENAAQATKKQAQSTRSSKAKSAAASPKDTAEEALYKITEICEVLNRFSA